MNIMVTVVVKMMMMTIMATVVVKTMKMTIMVTVVVMVLMMIRTVSCGARWYLLHRCVLHHEWIARLI